MFTPEAIRADVRSLSPRSAASARSSHWPSASAGKANVALIKIKARKTVSVRCEAYHSG